MSNSFDPAGQNASENSSTDRSLVFCIILYYMIQKSDRFQFFLFHFGIKIALQ